MLTNVRHHATGVDRSHNPLRFVNDMASIDYNEADDQGYFKLDLLNVYVYELVKDEKHLISLMIGRIAADC